MHKSLNMKNKESQVYNTLEKVVHTPKYYHAPIKVRACVLDFEGTITSNKIGSCLPIHKKLFYGPLVAAWGVKGLKKLYNNELKQRDYERIRNELKPNEKILSFLKKLVNNEEREVYVATIAPRKIVKEFLETQGIHVRLVNPSVERALNNHCFNELISHEGFMKYFTKKKEQARDRVVAYCNLTPEGKGNLVRLLEQNGVGAVMIGDSGVDNPGFQHARVGFLVENINTLTTKIKTYLVRKFFAGWPEVPRRITRLDMLL